MADLISSAVNQAMKTLGLGPGGGGGELAKAGLLVTEGKQKDVTLSFLFNPETVTVEKSSEYQDHPTQGSDSSEKEWTHGAPRTLKVASVYFDTYESKANVRTKFIDKIEALAHYDTELHRPPKVLFVWGNFMAQNDPYNSCKWYVTRVNVQYVMFLNDGTPVRAKVDFDLSEATTIDEQMEAKGKHSPDHAKVYTVQRGDTLQGIAFREYDTPAEWRRIAEANAIDDPMGLEPGTKLLVPPILK